MDFDDEDDDSLSLDKLYDLFNEALTDNKPLDDFEEDDYCDIFDYAGDIADEFTQTEVIMAGLRRFPKSRKLLERKLILYLNQGNERGAIYVAERLPDSSFIGRLAWLRMGYLNDPEKLTGDLDRLFTAVRKNSLSDEEVIQLVDLANSCGIMSWLVERIIKISALSQYPATVYYEAAQNLVRAGEYEKANSLLQTLTSIEPFNDVYWSFRAEIEADRLNDFEAALTSIEYSLAINPSPTRERLMKAHYLAMTKAPFEQVKSLLDELLEENPFDTDLQIYRAQVLNDYGHKVEAEDHLKNVYHEAFNRLSAISTAISVCGRVPDWADDKSIGEIFASNSVQEELHNYIRGLLMSGEYKTAIRLLRAGISTTGNDVVFTMLTEALYMDGQYDEILHLWRQLVLEFEQFVNQTEPLADNQLARIRQVATTYPDSTVIYFIALVNTLGVTENILHLKDYLTAVMQSATPKLFSNQITMMSRLRMMNDVIAQNSDSSAQR